MYEELVKRLREATGWKNASEHYSLMKEAADAIEGMSATLDAYRDLFRKEALLDKLPPKEETK